MCDSRRSHEGQQFTRLDDAVDIAEDSLWLLRVAILNCDSDTLPAEAPDIFVRQLSVVTTACCVFNIKHPGIAIL